MSKWRNLKEKASSGTKVDHVDDDDVQQFVLSHASVQQKWKPISLSPVLIPSPLYIYIYNWANRRGEKFLAFELVNVNHKTGEYIEAVPISKDESATAATTKRRKDPHACLMLIRSMRAALLPSIPLSFLSFSPFFSNWKSIQSFSFKSRVSMMESSTLGIAWNKKTWGFSSV